MEVKERKVLSYKAPDGSFPFREWRETFTDFDSRAAIDARITRFATGNLGDSDSIGEGASESRIDHGPGLRIYYGADGDRIVLLGGGDKSTQDADIKKARKRWTEYKERTKLLRKQQKKKF